MGSEYLYRVAGRLARTHALAINTGARVYRFQEAALAELAVLTVLTGPTRPDPALLEGYADLNELVDERLADALPAAYAETDEAGRPFFLDEDVGLEDAVRALEDLVRPEDVAEALTDAFGADSMYAVLEPRARLGRYVLACLVPADAASLTRAFSDVFQDDLDGDDLDALGPIARREGRGRPSRALIEAFVRGARQRLAI